MRAVTGSTALRFRAATPADVPAIVALVESAYRGDSSRAGWTTEADLLEGRRTGAVERQGDTCYFGMFSVRPALQGGGIGNAVLAECERLAREEWGCRALHMTVIRVRTELIAWYERRGYRATGESKPFPYGDPRFGLPKRDDLDFIILSKPLL